MRPRAVTVNKLVLFGSDQFQLHRSGDFDWLDYRDLVGTAIDGDHFWPGILYLANLGFDPGHVGIPNQCNAYVCTSTSGCYSGCRTE